MKKKKNNKKNNTKKNSILKGKFYLILATIFFIISLIFLGLILWLDILPTKIFSIVVGTVVIIDVVIMFFLMKKNIKKKIKIFFSVIAIFFILVMSLISFYLYKTLGFFLSMDSGEYKVENYSVLVLKDSEYTDIASLKNETIGYYDKSTGYKTAKSELDKVVSLEYGSYDDINELIEDLYDSKISAILIEDSMKTIIEEQLIEFSDTVRVLHTFSIKTEVESTVKDVNVTAKPFIVYISGIDTYGEISSVSRSDVNMLMVVNPKT